MPPFRLDTARLHRKLATFSNNSSIREGGRNEWISETCFLLKEIGDNTLNWQKGRLQRSDRILTAAAWLLRDCGLNLMDACSRPFKAYTGEDLSRPLP